jgi:flagellar biosynthesis protein FlhF
MNMKRFTARTSREALAMVRQAFGEDAVVMSTRPCAEGVEVLAMAPESVMQLERIEAPDATPLPAMAAAPAKARPTLAQRVAAAATGKAAALRQPPVEPAFGQAGPVNQSVEQDVADMAMSTLSFQDYVRERMLKRRRSELDSQAAPEPVPVVTPMARVQPKAVAPQRAAAAPAPASAPTPATVAAPTPRPVAARPLPVLKEEIRIAPARAPVLPMTVVPALADAAARHDDSDMLNELRSMRGLIEQRFGALAFMEKLQRQPRHALLTQTLLEHGLSPQLIRRLAESLPAQGDPMAWAGGVLERNLVTDEKMPALEEHGGVYALIGSTGVGKTTSTAKLAAAFAARHGPSQLGLITLDAYRMGAHDQLRAYGRILGVPVHMAHDRASLEDLLELFAGKKMVLIDTAGMAQRDSRTRELLDMLQHASVQKLLVMNAAAQGETFEDVVSAYGAASCRGVVLSKIDEAVKLGPALDVLIRHKLKVLAVANGQRVPEDWHRLSANALVQRALRSQAAPAWRHDTSDMNLVFAGVPHPVNAPAAMHAAAMQ